MTEGCSMRQEPLHFIARALGAGRPGLASSPEGKLRQDPQPAGLTLHDWQAMTV